MPTTNRDWWVDKLDQNVRRDERVARQLEEAGWTLMVVWEHEDMKTAADSIERLVRPTPP